jgi:hypothetical protein
MGRGRRRLREARDRVITEDSGVARRTSAPGAPSRGVLCGETLAHEREHFSAALAWVQPGPLEEPFVRQQQPLAWWQHDVTTGPDVDTAANPAASGARHTHSVASAVRRRTSPWICRESVMLRLVPPPKWFPSALTLELAVTNQNENWEARRREGDAGRATRRTRCPELRRQILRRQEPLAGSALVTGPPGRPRSAPESTGPPLPRIGVRKWERPSRSRRRHRRPSNGGGSTSDRCSICLLWDSESPGLRGSRGLPSTAIAVPEIACALQQGGPNQANFSLPGF